MRADLPAFGPILLFRGLDAEGLHLAALFGRPEGAPLPELRCDGTTGAWTDLLRIDGFGVGRIDLTLPRGPGAAHYHVEGQTIPVQTRFEGDLRLAFAACNGQEHGDFDRPEAQRNALWQRLLEDHLRAPFALLLHGGDQIYADQDVKSHPLTRGWPDSLPREVTAAEVQDVQRALRRAFMARYCRLYSSPTFAAVAARIPGLAMWDDHDICDGWGSLERSRTRSAIGQALFAVARQMFLLFQHGAVDADIPALFADPEGVSLGWHHRLPGFDIIAPDLRSERGRRQILGARGWSMMEALRDGPARDHVFLVSTVPLLGPRLSIVERLLMLIPSMQKYEDDLRDQWQSRAHREEWQRMLRLCLALLERGDVTALSGEIHLATQARMAGGARDLMQLIASGIAHEAPPVGYARALGFLAGLGEAPLRGHPITLSPLPGQRRRYVAERNYLTLARQSGQWQAQWELEFSGRTPPLLLSSEPKG